MRTNHPALPTLLALACAAPLFSGDAAAAAPAERKRSAPAKMTRPAAKRTDPRVTALLRRVEIASRAAKTMTADFTYSVTGIKRIQFVTGSVQLMKPNLARISFSHLAEPAYPNIFASDGEKVYTFTPANFNVNTRAFAPDPAFDPVDGAKAASGLGGRGSIRSEPARPDGSNIRLWDSIAIQSFFNVRAGISHLFFQDDSELRYEGEQVVGGVRYRVISHYFPTGNIPGGEITPFWRRVYVGPDDLIHRYVLEFRSGGRPGIQVMRLENIRINGAAPLTKADFDVPTPTDAP